MNHLTKYRHRYVRPLCGILIAFALMLDLTGRDNREQAIELADAGLDASTFSAPKRLFTSLVSRSSWMPRHK